MTELKKYRLGFDFSALVLFLLIMVPNFIWFAVPAPDDVLRTASSSAALDAVGSACQALTVAALCLVVRRERKELRATPLMVSAAVCCLVYFACWAVYYAGIVNAAVILGLTLSPCGALLLFAVGRGNIVAVVPGAVFTVCHFIHGLSIFL